MHHHIEWLQNVIFDWCTNIVVNMKKQLTDFKMRSKKSSSYVSILIALYFEWILGLRPRVTLPLSHPHKTRLTRWGDVLVRYGGGEIRVAFDDDF